MAKTNTKQLILEVALVLLNERGESAITSVDIAHEMNISPGNLYYHFKGKEEIVLELYAEFHARTIHTLKQIVAETTGDAKTTLASLAVVSDIFQQFRFISQDLHGLSERYPDLVEPISNLISLVHRTLTTLIKLMMDQSNVRDSKNASRLLASNLMYTLLHFGSYDDFLSEDESALSIEEHLYLHFLPFM